MRFPLAIGVALGGIVVAGAASAQRFEWPAEPENLKVLEGFTGDQLRPVMRGFSQALGVRCWYCHVGEEGQSLAEMDFASDDNPKKETAREMLRMLGSINEHLQKIEPSGSKRVNMWCHTCHNGRPRPTTLTEELEDAYAAGGSAAVVERHAELREQYLDTGRLRFDEEGLNALGYRALGDGDVQGAIRIFRVNADTYPESGNVWDSLAEAYATAGERELAIVSYERALLLEPRNSNARDKLRELGAFGTAPEGAE